ncbi:MAG: DUF1499 domain-containing protein [Pseudohongiellaceae bacterium]
MTILNLFSDRKRLGLYSLGGLALLAGGGIGLLALTASVGVWFGWWDFRRGFDLLRIANNHADWIALACLAATITLPLADRLLRAGTAFRPGVLALTGTLAAALVYYYPQTFSAPEGVSYPPIHDISTDILNPPQFVDVLPLRVDAPNSTVYGDSPRLNAEELGRLTREAYPDLQPLRLSDSPDQVFARAMSAVESLGWELVASVPEDGRIEATDTTFWFRFKDDVIIKITREGAETLVNARSLSRVGGGDVGTNAKRLRAFFALL